MSDPWLGAYALRQAALILSSYRRLAGAELVPPPASGAGSLAARARVLYESPTIVLSHGIESDPIVNYGNAAALALWEMPWESFIRMPSRLTTDPATRAERDRQLAAAAASGIIRDYSGVRVSSSGRLFRISGATIWNLVDDQGWRRGQAAAFSQWEYV